jgi:hypothetical protein
MTMENQHRKIHGYRETSLGVPDAHMDDMRKQVLGMRGA